MNEFDLLEAIGDIDDKFIEKAAIREGQSKTTVKKVSGWRNRIGIRSFIYVASGLTAILAAVFIGLSMKDPVSYQAGKERKKAHDNASQEMKWVVQGPVKTVYHDDDFCNVSSQNVICQNKHYAEVSATASTSNSSVDCACSVSATFYVFDAKTNQVYSYELNNEGDYSAGVSGIRIENEKIIKVTSSFTVMFGGESYSGETLTNYPQ